MAAAVVDLNARRGREKNRKEIESAADLEQRLTGMLGQYPAPALREILETAILAAHRVAISNRKRDRDEVFNAIEPRGCRTVQEICEETGLVSKVVRRILDEFVTSQLIEVRESEDVEAGGGRPVKEYWPRHNLPGSPFFILNRK